MKSNSAGEGRAAAPVIRMRDIAAKAGVSRAAVSMALSNKGTLSEATRAHVLAVANELGYRANAFARATKKGRSGAIALLMSADPFRSAMTSNLFVGLHEALAESEYHLILCAFADELLTDEKYLPRILREWACDGVVVNYHSGVPARLANLIERFNVPAVWVNAKRSTDAVYIDEIAGGERAARFVRQRGARQVLYVDRYYEFSRSQNIRHYSRVDRMSGAASDCETHKLGFEMYVPAAPGDPAALLAELVRRLRDKPAIDGIICVEPGEAELAAAADRIAGLDLLQRGRIVTFGPKLVETAFGVVPTLCVPEREMAYRAGKEILKSVEVPRPRRSTIIGYDDSVRLARAPQA